MAAMRSRCGHYIFVLFLLSSSFFSPNLGGRRLDVYHTSTHGVVLVRAYNAGLKCDASGSLEMMEIGWRVWGTPSNFNGFRVLSLLLQRRRSTKGNHTLHYVWPSPRLVRYIYIFGGFCPLTEFCHVQTSLCVQVLRSPILAALLHGTRPVGVSQTLRHGTRNRITELSQTAPSIYRWAAIALGIGPHSSYGRPA